MMAMDQLILFSKSNKKLENEMMIDHMFHQPNTL